MICLQCDSEDFRASEAEVKQEFKGETLMVKTPVVLCNQCGWHTVGNDQIDELRRRTADVYRRKHGLLTSEEIKAYRKLLRKSQREFAAFLGVGEASVKRWETWLVQEKSSDNLIRALCDKALLEQIATSAWISFAPPAQGPAKTVLTSRWDEYVTALFEPASQTVMAFHDVAEPEACGPSPPQRRAAAEAALSFSMRSRLIESASKKKDAELQCTVCLAPYGTNTPIAFAG